MLDVLNLPKPQNGYIDYFFAESSKLGDTWRTWEKPRGISMIYITCIGGGGGGRSGWCADSNTRSGGAGGGSSGFSTLLIPAMVLPDVLYVAVGRGGAGGASVTLVNNAAAGSNGIGSFVSIAPSTAAIYVACFANGGSGAGNNVVGANTAGLAAGVATQANNALMSGLGQFFALAGHSGAAGPTGTATALSYPATGLLLSGGGAGGGGNGFTGGNLNVPTSFPGFPLFGNGRDGGLAASTANPGGDGLSLFQPLMSIGGAGGGSSSSITSGVGRGGRGGNGGIGCGGGGGGAGPSGTGSGAGGKGGDGLVIIQCY